MKKKWIKINYRSDFDFLLSYKNEKEENPVFPSYDFKGEIWPERVLDLDEIDYRGKDWREMGFMTGIEPYVFFQKGDRLLNCFNDNGRVHVVVNNHNLPTGGLILWMVSHLPNPIYPDGERRIVDRRELKIKLVKGNGDCNANLLTLEFMAPFIYTSAYELAKKAGFTGTEEEYCEALNKVDDLSKRAEEVIAQSDEIEEKITEFDDRYGNKVDSYPDSPPKDDDCQRLLMNGEWVTVAAPGELILVSGK